MLNLRKSHSFLKKSSDNWTTQGPRWVLFSIQRRALTKEILGAASFSFRAHELSDKCRCKCFVVKLNSSSFFLNIVDLPLMQANNVDMFSLVGSIETLLVKYLTHLIVVEFYSFGDCCYLNDFLNWKLVLSHPCGCFCFHESIT